MKPRSPHGIDTLVHAYRPNLHRKWAKAGAAHRSMMIEIATYADLHRAGHSLAYHCWRCALWSDADLAAIIAA